MVLVLDMRMRILSLMLCHLFVLVPLVVEAFEIRSTLDITEDFALLFLVLRVRLLSRASFQRRFAIEFTCCARCTIGARARVEG